MDLSKSTPLARAIRGARAVLGREVLPDPAGFLGFALAAFALFTFLSLSVSAEGAWIWSPNVVVESLAHALLLLAPPVSVYLGIRHLLLRGDSAVPLVTVPLGLLLTAVSLVSVGAALFA